MLYRTVLTSANSNPFRFCFCPASVHPNHSLRGLNCSAVLERAVQKAASEMVVLEGVQDLARQSPGWSDRDLILMLAAVLWEMGLETFTSPLWPTVLRFLSNCFLLFQKNFFSLHFFHLIHVALNALKYYFLMHVLIIHWFSVHHSLVNCFSIPYFIWLTLEGCLLQEAFLLYTSTFCAILVSLSFSLLCLSFVTESLPLRDML